MISSDFIVSTQLFGVAEFDQFRLPPMFNLKNADIELIMSMLGSKRARKYWAAAIILGQPFA